MKICLIGDGLTNLILAKILANKGIEVLLCNKQRRNNTSIITRTISISKYNFNFLKKNSLDIKKICWPINYIKIFNESNLNNEILNFGSNNNELFYLFKQNKLYNYLQNNIKKNKFIKKLKVKNNFFYSIIKKNNFNLIINSDNKIKIINNLFSKKISRDYNSTAFTSLIKHDNISNNSAFQIFTKFGPLAFLPYSKNETSIVFSVLNKKKITDKEIKELIVKYNKFYKINTFSKFEKFNLKFSTLRKYYYKKILCFGDNLHKVHPLAGQGFNMTLRDIQILSDLIDNKINLGLDLDSSLLKEFELKTKHLNYIFSFGINFINDFFKIDNKYINEYSSRMIKYLNQNKLFKKYTLKFADKGLVI